MVYSYSPAYYSSLQHTITSLCKSILPFSHKNRRLPERRHADNLKWQQESFHKILQLIGLHKEGIVPESEVSAFRSHLLDTLIASPAHHEPPTVIRDKLLFLQELLFAKCITNEEYHASKRPLLQRLAVQGAEVDVRDVIVGGDQTTSEEEWSVIELRDDEECPMAKPKPKTNHRSTPMKSLLKSLKGKGNESMNSTRGPLGPLDFNRSSSNSTSVLMSESSPVMPVKSAKAKKKPFGSMFQKEVPDENCSSKQCNAETKSAKKQWGFDGFKKWKKSEAGDHEDESTAVYLSQEERSEDGSSSVSCRLLASPAAGEGPDTRRIKSKIHSDGSPSDFFIDKVLGENIKKELSRIQSELSTTNPNLNLSEDQMEVISTKLPVDKADLKNYFPKSWCERYGDVMLDVVKKEFKDHVGEMQSLRNAGKEAKDGSSSEKWVSFGDQERDENFHPNLFHGRKQKKSGDCFVNNPFHEEQNPFWSGRNKVN